MTAMLVAALPALLARAGVRAGARVLVAVSGGADSMALLHLLRFHAAPPALHIEVVHFDHRMRPGSSGDADWVRGVCVAWDLPLHTGAAHAQLAGETQARAARWAFLLETADRTGADAVLTAHHADDQAETVLHRLARGTGLAGLAGIPRRRRAHLGDRQILVARPLLDVRRTDLVGYCRANRLSWREDPTNLQATNPRNRIRLRLLPAMERAYPGATQRLTRLAALAREAENAWSPLLRDIAREVVRERGRGRVVLAREALLGYDPRVRSRVLRRELRRFGRAPGRSGTRAVDEFISYGTSGKAIALRGGIRVERDRDRIVLRRAEPASENRTLRIVGPERGGGVARIGGRRVRAQWAPGRGPGGADTFDVDPSTVAFPLELRGWQPGDRIRLAYGGKKLKKLFLERGLGRAERARTPVLTDAAGRVLWVPGVARAHDAGPGAGASGFHITVVA